jgi:purine-binding chemotaxis protein CheW
MMRAMQVLEFQLAEARYAVPVERVIEVVPRVWVTPLPGAAPVVAGVFNYRGSVTVAVDLRPRLGHPSRSPTPDDHLIVVQGARRVLALVVDRVSDLRALEPGSVQAPSIPLRHVRGIAALDDGLLLIEDLDAVLSLDEEESVDRGLQRMASAP